LWGELMSKPHVMITFQPVLDAAKKWLWVSPATYLHTWHKQEISANGKKLLSGSIMIRD